MRLFFLYFITSCAILLISPPGVLAQGEDYEFYKKHGHSNKLWNEAVKKGFTAYENQDCDGALTHLNEAIRLQAQDGLIYFKMAVCTELKGSPYTALQYYQLAHEKLQKLQAVHRYQRDIFENYGRALLKANKKEEAMPYLTRAAAVGSPSFTLFYLVGSLYAENKNWVAALDYYKKALTQDTTGVDPKLLSQVYFQVARTYVEKKDLKQAVAHLDKAIQLDPKNREAQQMRNQVGVKLQQQQMLHMIDGLSEVPQLPASVTGKQEKPPSSQQAGKSTTGSKPPPPAASKLPPLNPPAGQDPTPPLGQVQNP